MVYKIKLVLVARIGEGEDVQKQRRIYREEEEEGQQDGRSKRKTSRNILHHYITKLCFVKKRYEERQYLMIL
jgi:hypothetical protein